MFFRERVNWAAYFVCPVLNVSWAISVMVDLNGFGAEVIANR